MKNLLYITIITLCLFSCSTPPEIEPAETKTIKTEKPENGIIIEVDQFTTQYEFDIYI